MKTFLRFFTIALLSILLFFALQSSPALAKTTTARPVVVHLKHDMGEYYFTPTTVLIEIDTPLVIVNQTGRDVTLTSNGNFDGVLLRGESYVTAFYEGMYRFSDAQGNIRVPLVVTVQDS